MSKKISELPQYIGAVQPTGDIPISIGGNTYRIDPSLLIPVIRKYKVYTALLSQSGSSDPQSWSTADGIYVGNTYTIAVNTNLDVTNIGAPNNNVGTSFVATGTIPASPGVGGAFYYDPGAPIVTVLENNIGNIWFTYEAVGHYTINSNNLFAINKTWTGNSLNISGFGDNVNFSLYQVGLNRIGVVSGVPGDVQYDNYLNNLCIEIRVYE